MVPIAYSTVDIPSSSVANNVSRAHSVRILLPTIMLSPHFSSAVTESPTPVHRRPTRRPRAQCPSTRMPADSTDPRSEEHTSELQSHVNLVCRLLLEKKKSTIR